MPETLTTQESPIPENHRTKISDYKVGLKIYDAHGNVALQVIKLTDGTLKTTHGGYLIAERIKGTRSGFKEDKKFNVITEHSMHQPLEIPTQLGSKRFEVLEQLPDEKDKRVWFIKNPVYIVNEKRGIPWGESIDVPKSMPASKSGSPMNYESFLTMMDKFHEQFDKEKLELEADESVKAESLGRAIVDRTMERADKKALASNAMNPVQYKFIEEAIKKRTNDEDLFKLFNERFGTSHDKKSLVALRQDWGLDKGWGESGKISKNR